MSTPENQEAFEACVLPKVVRELAVRLGSGPALKFLLQFSNREIYIPTADHLAEDHPIATCLGIDDAKKLAAIYGGGVIRMPRGVSYFTAARNLRIRQLAEDGHSVAWIAQREDLTQRYVRTILYEP